MEYFDDFINSARIMIQRTGSHSQTPESIIKIVLANINSGDLFFLVGIDDENQYFGFMAALLIHDKNYPWVEVLGISTKPRWASSVKVEANKHLENWCRLKGAKKIVTIVTRKAKRDKWIGELFYNWFHKPLGYKQVGTLLEKEL